MTAEFEWEPLDFLEYFRCAPKTKTEFGLDYEYEVTRENLRLTVTIWPMDREVQVSIHVSSQIEPIVHLRLLGTPGARVVNDKRGKFIEFAAANLFAGRFDFSAPAPYGFRLWAESFITVEPYRYET